MTVNELINQLSNLSPEEQALDVIVAHKGCGLDVEAIGIGKVGSPVDTGWAVLRDFIFEDEDHEEHINFLEFDGKVVIGLDAW